jgi:hypothetical protein
MLMRTISVWLCLTLTLAPAAAWTAEPEELTLTQAVQLALKDNRQIQVARLDVDKFNDRLAVARTHRLPQFEFSMLAAEMIKKFISTSNKATWELCLVWVRFLKGMLRSPLHHGRRFSSMAVFSSRLLSNIS